MSHEHPDASVIAGAALSRIPPWPPQEETGGDDGPSIVVVINEHRRLAGNAESADRIVDFTIDPRRNHSILQSLSLHDLPALLVSVSYFVANRSISVMIQQGERDLLTLSSPGPADSYMTGRLSPDIVMSILVHRHSKI
jgi:hypothetical protein